jgi:hypothetical protein
MTNWRLMTGMAAAVMLCSAHSAAGDRSISNKMDGSEVRVVVRSVQNAKHLNTQGVAVYGDVLVQSESRLKNVDLGCILLAAGEARSSKPYVDSVAHVMTNSYPADTDGAVRVKLYWVFPGRKITEFKPNELTLSLDQSRGPCGY